MKSEFEARILLRKLPLSPTSRRALRYIERYDVIIFTSKNAENFFRKGLRGRMRSASRVIRVGPRNDLLKLDLASKRVLFPRSALAPADIVGKLRAKGSIVRVIPLYTAVGAPLSIAQKKRLLDGTTKQLYFRSQSGINGLLRQFRGRARRVVLSIPARCIGETTAQAARAVGFKKVFIR